MSIFNISPSIQMLEFTEYTYKMPMLSLNRVLGSQKLPETPTRSGWALAMEPRSTFSCPMIFIH